MRTMTPGAAPPAATEEGEGDEHRLPDDAVLQIEAARLVKVHPNTIKRWVDRGLVRAWRVGIGRMYLSAAEVKAQIRRVRVGEGPLAPVRTPAEDQAAADAARRRIDRRGW